MTQIEELLDVYVEIPEVPCRELCGLAVQLLEDRVPLIETLQQKLGIHHIVSEDVVDCLAPLIFHEHPDKPLAWHFARALALDTQPLRPRLAHDAQKALELARDQIEPVAETAQGFLLDGLFLMSPEPWLIEHIEAEFCSAALEVVAFSRQLQPAGLPKSLATLALMEARARLESVGSRHDDEPEILRLPANDRGLIAIAVWLAETLRTRDDAAFLLASVSEPWPTVIATSPTVDHIHDDLYEVDGKRWTEREVIDLLGSEYVHLAHLDSKRPFGKTLCDLRMVHFPKEPTVAGEAALALVKAQPGFIGQVMRELATFGDGLEPHQLVALAATDQRLLITVASRWPQALEGAEALIEMAKDVVSVEKRVEILLAIGSTAQEALVENARVLLKSCSDGSGHHALVLIADSSPLLSLSFWEKALTRPGTFRALQGSNRLAASWQLRPRPLLKAMRVLANRGHIDDARAILFWLSDKVWPALREGAPDAIALIEKATPAKLSVRTAVFLLARVGTPEAKDVAHSLLEGVRSDEDDGREDAVFFDALWELFHERGLVDGRLVLQWAYDEEHHRYYIARAPARALVDHILAHGLGEMEEVVTSDPRRIAQVIYRVASTEEVRRIGELIPRFERFRVRPPYYSDLDTLPRDKDPSWMVPLLDDDRARLLPEIGALCAQHLHDREWAREIPVLIRDALRARCLAALGPEGERLMQHLGDRWPTQSALRDGAEELEITLDPAALDRCADEGLPPFFRAAVAALPGNGSEFDELAETPPAYWLQWILRECWADEPALVSRHLVGELQTDRCLTWIRGVALALVALREPVGTTVPNALTRMANELPEAKEFLIRQRDTFERESTVIERSKPGAYRTRQAQQRLLRAAGQVRRELQRA